jgi:hypothetical protein
MPISTLENVNVLDNFTYMQERMEPDVANVGYYKTVLSNGITAELTATAHAGIVQYSFASGGERHILVDVSHMLPSSGEAQHSQFYSNGFLERSPDGRQYQGYGVYRGGFSDRTYIYPSIIIFSEKEIQGPMPQSISVRSLTPSLRRSNSSRVSTRIHTGQTALTSDLQTSRMQLR